MNDFVIILSSDIYDKYFEELRSSGDPRFSWKRVDFSCKPENYLSLLETADCIVSRSDLSNEEYSQAVRLKLLQIPIAGYEQIDLARASRKGVYVCNNGGANSISVSEHVFLLVLNIYRQFLYHNKAVMQGPWENRKYSNLEMFGKTMGIVGLGKCGKEVAKRAKAFGITVVYNDLYKDKEFEISYEIDFKDYNELLSISDIITYHVPLTNKTRKMINESSLKLMKSSALLINVARGEIQNEIDLYNALEQKKIMAAGLDVFEHEPILRDSSLLKLSNVVLTPHSAPSLESTYRMRDNILHNVIKIFNGEKPDFIVIDYDLD